jgi:hypothetical protein
MSCPYVGKIEVQDQLPFGGSTVATKISLVCDVCGSETLLDEGRYTISWNAQEVEVDLCETHRAPLDKLINSSGITPHKANAGSALAKAKELAAQKGTRTGTSQRIQTMHPDSRAVRAWAESNGIEVNPRGRISNDIVAMFLKAEH